MVSKLRSLVMAGVVLGLLVVPAFSATVISTTTYNFDASDPVGGTAEFRNQSNALISNTTVTGAASSHLGAGVTDGLLGPFGTSSVGIVTSNQYVAMTITSPGPQFNAITLEFDLWVINSWDGNGWSGQFGTFTADQFQVAVGGSAPSGTSCTSSALCTTFGQSFPGVNQNFGYAPGEGPGRTAGTPGILHTRPASQVSYFTTPGFDSSYTFAGYDVYRINLGTINFGPTNTVTVYFRGLFSGTLQSGNDESWALSRVSYSAIGPDVGEIPEPSTMVLGGLGLALLAFARIRARKS
jgi:hypothetical protein